MLNKASEKKAIALLLDSRHSGGIETHVLQLALALHRLNIPVNVWFYRRYNQPHPIEAQLHHHNIDVTYLDGTLSTLRKTLIHHRPLLLHAHGYKANIVGRIAAHLSKTPIITTFHNGDKGCGRVRLYTWLDQLTSYFSTNIAVSEAIANRPIYRPKRINNFVNIQKKTQRNGHAIAFVGRLSHEKGPDLFLQLAKHQPDLSFHVYGGGPMEHGLKEQHVPNVAFIGHVHSMNDHWRDIGLLCLTSRVEGLPMVSLEAMAHGIPVVSFPVGELPTLITQGQNGWITPPGDLVSMSNMVQFWYSLPERIKVQLQQACTDTIIRRYSPEVILPQLLTVYNDAIHARHPAESDVFSDSLARPISSRPISSRPTSSHSTGG